MVVIKANLVEFLIPITILIVALFDLFTAGKSGKKESITFVAFITIFFGIIHGLGFSNYLKELLGRESSIWQPLLAFNIGLEVGQIVIVIAYLLITSLLSLVGVNRKDWTLIVSAFVLGVACMLMLETKFW